MIREMVYMRLSVKICLLIGILLPIAATYCHVYEERSIGLLPVINYPLRLYTMPLLVVGFLLIFSGIVLHKVSSETR